MPASRPMTPLVLLVGDDRGGTAVSLEGVLKPKGHVVLRAQTGSQALDLCAKVSPDAILISTALPDHDAIDLLRELRRSGTIHVTTPALVVDETGLGKAERLEALGSGAWDILTAPIDAGELLLRLDTLIKSKHEVDRVRDEGLTDPGTGLYNVRGVLQRAKEATADAVRSGRPIACVVFGSRSGTGPSGPSPEAAVEDVIPSTLRVVTRESDTLGAIGGDEFVVLAPGTSEEGAMRLADRVLESLTRNEGALPAHATSAKALRAGYCSVTASGATSAEDLLLRATMALRRAQQDDGSFRVRAYDA